MGLTPIGFTLLWSYTFVLIIMVLIPLVQEKESGVKVSDDTELSFFKMEVLAHSYWK